LFTRFLSSFRPRNGVQGTKAHVTGFAVEHVPQHLTFAAVLANLKPQVMAIGVSARLL